MINLTAFIVPKVACELPLRPIFDRDWNHLSDISLADPDFASPGKVDIRLGVEAFVAVLLDGRWSGLPGLPVVFRTKLGWVLAGNPHLPSTQNTVVAYHACFGYHWRRFVIQILGTQREPFFQTVFVSRRACSA